MKPMQPMQPMKPLRGLTDGETKRWWPESLGDHPNSAGGQNEVRYVYFSDTNRLAVDSGNGKIKVYDTGGHKISGVQQAQRGNDRQVVFSSNDGDVDLAQLQQVSA